MQVKWAKFLGKLGCTIVDTRIEARQPCPLHPAGDKTLSVVHDPVNDSWRFDCNHTQCNFSGDAVALVARVRHLNMDEALSLFRPGNELADTLVEDFTGTQLDNYLSDRSSQVRIAAYVNRAQQALRNTAKGDNLRNKLSDHGALQRSSGSLQDVPKCLGLVIDDDIPPVLRELKRYNKAHCAIYPYTYDGRITSVRVQNFDDATLPHITIPVVRSDIGLFMEENLPSNTEQIFVATNELTACILHRKSTEMSATPIPLVACAGLPFPSRFTRLQDIFLLTAKDAPMSLETALRFYAATQFVESSRREPTLTVIYCGESMQNLAYNRLLHPHQQRHYHSSLPLWILRQIDDAITDQRVEIVYRAFDAVSVSEADKAVLLRKVDSCTQPAKVAALLESVGKPERNILRLANGKEIRRTPTGLMATSENGNEKTLSNVALDVENCVFTRESEIKYTCKLRAAIDAPVITAQLRGADFARASTLLKAVQHTYLLQGQAIYPAFYDIPGYQWPDILSKLTEGKEVRQEITALGLDNGRIHFPHVTLDTVRKVIEPQQRVFTLSPHIMHMYAGLRQHETQLDSGTAIKRLIEAATTNVYCAGLLAGICQLVYLLVRGAVLPAPQHMFYVEPEPGLWTPIFRQLVQLLSDVDEVPRLPTVRLREYLTNAQQLGILPCVQVFPELSNRMTSRIVADSPVNLISLLPSDTANCLTGDSRVSFAVMPDVTAPTAYALDPQDITELRNSLPGFLLQMAVQAPTESERLGMRMGAPALATFHMICRTLGLPKSEALDKVVCQHHTVSGISCSYTFLHVLKQIFDRPDTSDRIRIMQGMPTGQTLHSDKPPEIFVLPECVYIGHQIITIVNYLPKQRDLFNVASLTQDFERCGHLLRNHPDLRIDVNRYWPLDRKIWNKYVVGAPITLKVVTNSNVIQLPRMIAS